MQPSVRIVAEPADREACFAVRRTVFVEEQKVPPDLEWDEWDAVATHFLAIDGSGRPVGAARLVDRGGVAKIGRVAVLAEARGKSVGRLLMRAVLDEARRLGFPAAVLDSQVHALPFYERLGFVAEGDEFDEAGIPHRHMRLVL